MKADLKTYITGGKIADPKLAPVDGPSFTTVIKCADIVFTPREVGEFAAMWAAAMIMKECALRTDFYFDDYVFVDTIASGGEARGIKYSSIYEELQFWSNQFETVAALEEALVMRNRQSLVVNAPHGVALIAAMDWFVTRHRCRPPPIASIGQRRDKGVQVQNDQDMSKLSPSERLAISAMRLFEESRFSFMGLDGIDAPVDEKKDAPSAESVQDGFFRPTDKADPSKPGEMWGDRDSYYSFMDVVRVAAADGFRDEDRKVLDLFKKVVARFVPRCPPVEIKWLKPNHKTLGERLFALNQEMQRSSLPDPDMVVRREEELRAQAIRDQKEAAKAAQQQGGG